MPQILYKKTDGHDEGHLHQVLPIQGLPPEAILNHYDTTEATQGDLIPATNSSPAYKDPPNATKLHTSRWISTNMTATTLQGWGGSTGKIC